MLGHRASPRQISDPGPGYGPGRYRPIGLTSMVGIPYYVYHVYCGGRNGYSGDEKKTPSLPLVRESPNNNDQLRNQSNTQLNKVPVRTYTPYQINFLGQHGQGAYHIHENMI